jgi:hypothetical protein
VDLRSREAFRIVSDILPWIGSGGQGIQIAIAEIATDTPSMLGSWNLEGDGYSGISEVFSSGDLLAFSFEYHEVIQTKNQELSRWEDWSATSVRSWLQILDLADPKSPMPWAPVQIPGSLVSITDWNRAAATIFTRSGDRIAALGFNGETAPIIAEVKVGHTHVMIGSTLYTASSDGISQREFSSLSGSWNPASIWILDQASGIHTLHNVEGALAAVSHNQAWILGNDGAFTGYDTLGSANFDASARSGEIWFIPAGEYGCQVLKP